MKPKLILAMIILLLTGRAFAEGARQIPLLFNFQSALVDEGGNLLPDGSTALTFRVLDSNGAALYEESQDLEIVKGQVSAIVGNGVNPTSGTATGGVPADVFDPTSARYLQVEAVGHKPYDNLEIVTAPYALWADTALKVAPGAITSEMIGKGVITKDHLNDELISAIFPNGIPKTMLPSDTAYTGDFTNFSNTIQSTAGASKVGVNSSFIYSGSQTVQGVLKDLDLAVKKRQEEVEFAKKDYGTKVTGEETARKDADTALQKNIDDEAAARAKVDSDEATARQNADANEAAARSSKDTTLQSNINNEAATRAAGDGTLQSNINAEAGARQGADTSILGQLGAHTGATSAHGSNGALVGQNTLKAEVAVLDAKIDGVEADLDASAPVAIKTGWVKIEHAGPGGYCTVTDSDGYLVGSLNDLACNDGTVKLTHTIKSTQTSSEAGKSTSENLPVRYVVSSNTSFYFSSYSQSYNHLPNDLSYELSNVNHRFTSIGGDYDSKGFMQSYIDITVNLKVTNSSQRPYTWQLDYAVYDIK